MTKSILRVLLLAVLFTALAQSLRHSRAILRHLPAPVSDSAARADSPDRTGETDDAAAAAAANAAAIARYRADVDAATKRHMARLRDLHADFDCGLRERAPQRFDPARDAIPGIRSSLVGVKACGAIVVDAAMDKVRGGNRLDRRFFALLDTPFLRPCSDAAVTIATDTETFVKRLDAENAAFREELAAARDDLPPAAQLSLPVEAFRQDVAKIEAQLHEFATSGCWLAIGVGGEVFIRSTVALCRRLALRLGGRAIAKAGASAAASTADGPLPIIDVLGAAWTGNDVYKLQKQLPDAFANSLRETVDRLQRDTIAEARRTAQFALERHLDAAAELSSSAKRGL